MIEVRTPSRLHFGLLAFSPELPRQFGGVGLMIRRPDTLLWMGRRPDEQIRAEGRMNDRAVEFARRFLERAHQQGLTRELTGLQIRVLRIPRPHAGLGTGTQLGMAVARGVAALLDRTDLTVAQLAQLVGRGQRSAIGAHGFFHGGLIVEGGKRHRDDLSPLLVRLAFPDAWRVVLIRPHELEGLSGEREQAAFNTALAIPREVSAELCRLVLLGLAPAAAEEDAAAFGEALFELQQRVGECFASSQGGVYAHPMLEAIVRRVRSWGVPGVGQSSWGPSLYAVAEDDDQAQALATMLRQTFELSGSQLLVTRADNAGGAVREVQDRLSGAPA